MQPCRGSDRGGRVREGQERVGGPDGESDSLWRFAERTSGDDEPDAVASRLQNLLEAVFYGDLFFFREPTRDTESFGDALTLELFSLVCVQLYLAEAITAGWILLMTSATSQFKYPPTH